ncbi:ATP-binding domain-containing protein 4-like [Tropilaelaps mercedesae]|uniref:Diphthine--ammonia ligase n=1 Tax=Tropilaelaps mercedesae TaxID=418985 RepID=A0A1V9X418_9ACAR|nr:ATP-binding domain-containing protein 4-like [Tropilaelaps mercedesae]
MKVVALVSGGKDSCFNMMECVRHGHEIVALANLTPEDGKEELDSYMYQTVGTSALHVYAEAMDLPLFQERITGTPKDTRMYYTPSEDDEVEDLYRLLSKVRKQIPFDAISVGAIFSDYQRIRCENVCHRLGLTMLAYLWHREQSALLRDMIDSGVHAVIIKTAVLGLLPRHLGLTLAEILPEMLKLKDKYGLNVCGEGGEFESFTLDCPLFKKRIVLDELETVIHSDDAFSPVAYLRLKKLHLEAK